MRIETPVPNLSSQLAEVIRLYFSSDSGIEVNHYIGRLGEKDVHNATARLGESEGRGSFTIETSVDNVENKRRLQKAAKIAVYDALVNLTGIKQPWGSLTGVRPTKLYADIEKSGNDAYSEFTEIYRVSDKKTALCRDINAVQAQVDILAGGYGVYIGIPFCVSRCSYCSFPGRIAKRGEMEAYTDALLLEMQDMAARMDIGRCFSVYIGGGTPTSLGDELFGRLMQAVGEHFADVKEITLEAGRPDTINEFKLECAKAAGVNRICVNPQTMVDKTLELIGRRHTAIQLEDAYNMVRAAGFEDVNMDVIAGLPAETEAEFTATMRSIKRLAPESITCHTLSIKHGSKMNEFGAPETDGAVVANMVDIAAQYAAEMGMQPYYLYRQKYMAGNLENTGYAKSGFACAYNIANMGEQTSIIALGTGAISKIVEGDIIQRHANPRDIFIYMDRVRENGGMIHKILA